LSFARRLFRAAHLTLCAGKGYELRADKGAHILVQNPFILHGRAINWLEKTSVPRIGERAQFDGLRQLMRAACAHALPISYDQRLTTGVHFQIVNEQAHKGIVDHTTSLTRFQQRFLAATRWRGYIKSAVPANRSRVSEMGSGTATFDDPLPMVSSNSPARSCSLIA
jgi:hypothetical protein